MSKTPPESEKSEFLNFSETSFNMKRLCTRRLLILFFFVVLYSGFANAQAGPNVLVIQAHPDDETSFPIILYKITHDLKGTVDLAQLTDGQGGYNGSELGSVYYGLKLTDSTIGRSELPRIRKKEVMEAGDIMGIRQYYFFDQK